MSDPVIACSSALGAVRDNRGTWGFPPFLPDEVWEEFLRELAARGWKLEASL